MSFDNTITEQDMDAGTQQFVQGFRGDSADIEPDLTVDGLTDSILSRILGLFRYGRS